MLTSCIPNVLGRPHARNSFNYRLTLWALAPLLWVGPAFAAASGDVWITIGADAFGSLQSEASVLDGDQPLRAYERNEGVVLTRVRFEDLEAISEHIHEKYQRCSGFLYHGSLEEARSQLQSSTQNQRLGGPIAYTIDQPALVQSVLSELNEANILSSITALSTNFNNRYYQHQSGVDAVTWIRDLWVGYTFGRPDVTVELVNHSGWAQPSVVMTIPGSNLADEIVVLGGHLDSIASGSSNPNFSAPGADDNASGIATLSEVARAVLANGLRPQRTLKFMGYAAEEVGLRGSGEIAQQHLNDGENVVAVLQFDMTAFNGSSQDVFLYTDFTNGDLTNFLGQLLDTYLTDLTWSNSACGYGCSDHASWHNRGFPAAFAFEARFGQHNGSIHSTGDTVNTFGNTADHAVKFARLGVAFIVEVGVDTVPPMFADGFEAGNVSAWSGEAP